MVAGWEDGYPFCAAISSTDVGLDFCRRCPQSLVGTVLEARRPVGGSCPAGVRLLAFALQSRGEPDVVVLRIAPPAPRRAMAIAPQVRVAPALLGRVARETPRSDGIAVLGAARLIRSTAGRLKWQVALRDRGADRLRAASATLAQFIAATEEFQELYRDAVRQRRELERATRVADRLARDAVHVREHERARIAHQVHDTAAQSLVSAVRFLDAAAGELRASGGLASGRDRSAGLASVADHLDLANARLHTSLREIRGILDQLVPAGLELGLDQAIRYRHRDLLEETGIGGVVHGSLPRLQPWVEQVLYGMVSEAMANAARHSGGRDVSVECSTVRDRVVVVVRDDGGGIRGWTDGTDAASAHGTPHKGLGLTGLLRQARWLGGATRIRRQARGGTSVRISIPLARYRADRVPVPAAEAPR
jgi:signal transduction histidine kinase